MLPTSISMPVTQEEHDMYINTLKEVNKLLVMCKEVEKKVYKDKANKRKRNITYYRKKKAEADELEIKQKSGLYHTCGCGSSIVDNKNHVELHETTQYHLDWLKCKDEPKPKPDLSFEGLDLF